MWSLLRSGYHWFRSLSLSRAVERFKGGLDTRQVAALDYVLKHDGARLRAPEHAQFHQVSQPTAWKDLSQLRDQGLLRETKEGRASIYFASEKLLALAETRPRQ